MVRATKILQIVKEDKLCENAPRVGSYLQENLKRLAETFSKMSNVRGRGLLTAFDFPSKEMRDEFLKKGIEHNVLFLGCGNHSIRFRPELCIEKQQIDLGIEVMEKILPGYRNFTVLDRRMPVVDKQLHIINFHFGSNLIF